MDIFQTCNQSGGMEAGKNKAPYVPDELICWCCTWTRRYRKNEDRIQNGRTWFCSPNCIQIVSELCRGYWPPEEEMPPIPLNLQNNISWCPTHPGWRDYYPPDRLGWLVLKCGNINCSKRGLDSKFSPCKRCRTRSYCSEDCRVQAWELHKRVCLGGSVEEEKEERCRIPVEKLVEEAVEKLNIKDEADDILEPDDATAE